MLRYYLFSILSFFLIISSFAYTTKKMPCTYENTLISSILSVEFPEKISRFPSIKGYYKGNRLQFNGSFCAITEPSVPSSITLVITKEVNHVSGGVSAGNNVKWLERAPHTATRIFYIEYTGNSKNPWSIEEEKDLDKISLRLPCNSLILLIPAEYIETVASPTFDKDSLKSTNTNVIYLPEVIIKKDITEEELEQSQVAVTLAALDSDAIHGRAKASIYHKNNTVISFYKYS